MPEQDKEATDMQTRCVRAAVAQGLNDPQLHRPQQKVYILDDLVGESCNLLKPLATPSPIPRG